MSLRRGCQVVADMHTDRDRLNLIYYLASPANILYSTCLHYTLIACQINSVFCIITLNSSIDRLHCSLSRPIGSMYVVHLYRLDYFNALLTVGCVCCRQSSHRIFLNQRHSVCIFTRHICTNPPYINQSFSFIFKHVALTLLV